LAGSLLAPHQEVTAMAETVEERLRAAWARTDQIFDILTPDAWLAQPISLRHPFVFYVGHLPAFAWNHICGGVLGEPAFNAAYDELFSRGIDPDVDDPSRCHDHPDVPSQWPAPSAVLEYRDRVRALVLGAGAAVAERADVHPMAVNDRVFSMVIEHEAMHQETLLYMMQRLDFAAKRRPGGLPEYALGPGRTGGPVDVAAGCARLGAAFDELGFGWDNEFGAVDVEVPAFAIDATPVTNAQFLAFVEAGGYRRADLWREDDWAWRRHADLHHPVVWEAREGGLVYRTMFDLLPLDAVADWPVYVSLAEARAFARWKGGRLPTEAEYQRAAYGDGDAGGGASRPAAIPASARGNFDFRHWAPTPVGTHPDVASAFGAHDLIGDGWEWTDTPFAGLPGFEAYIPGYPGYSADFFDGKHFVLKGASWATPAELVRPSFRNWFQAHYPYVFAKLRCAFDR
jgi:ergothioneine biosynthesis protein EgtB